MDIFLDGEQLWDPKSLDEIKGDNYRMFKEEQSWDTCPADFNLAKKHAEANRIGKVRFDIKLMTKDQICECCFFPKIEKEFSLWCSREELAYLGPGLTLFLELIYLSLYILLGFSLICSLPFVFLALFYEENKVNEDDFLMNLSIFSIGDGVILESRTFLHFPTIVLIVLILKCVDKIQWKTLGKCDDRLLGPSDYTIMVQGLPKKGYTKDEISDFLLKLLNKNYTNKTNKDFLKVEKVVMTHDIRWKIKEYRKLSKTIERNKKKGIRFARDRKIYIIEHQVKTLNTFQIEDKSTKNIKGLESSKSVRIERSHDVRNDEPFQNSIECKGSPPETPVRIGKDHGADASHKIEYSLSGIVFVTFNRQDAVQIFENKFKINTFIWILKRFFFRKLGSVSQQQLMFKNSFLKIGRAPEPSEIIWENIGVPIPEYISRRIKGYAITFLMLLLSFTLVISCTYMEDYSKKVLNNQYYHTFMKAIKSLVIYIANEIILYGMGRITLYEKHKSILGFKTSLCIKSFQVQYLNTIFLVPLSRYFISKDSAESTSNLVQDIWILFLFLAFLQPIAELLNLDRLYRIIKKKVILSSSLKSLLTQREANKLLEGPAFDLPRKNVQLLLLIYFSVFYSAIIPMISIIAILGIALLYISSKYSLLRRSSRPYYLGPEMNFIISDYLKNISIHFLVSQIFFTELFLQNEAYHQKFTNINIICLCFAFVLRVFPWNILRKKKRKNIRQRTIKFLAEKEYADICLEFENDYDRANPLSKKEAIDLWVKKLDEKRASTIKVIGRESAHIEKLDNLKQFGILLGNICHSPEESMMAYASDGIKKKLISNTTEAYHKYNLNSAIWISRGTSACHIDMNFRPKSEEFVGSPNDRIFASERLKNLRNVPVKFIDSLN